jgi:hypothetical protein
MRHPRPPDAIHSHRDTRTAPGGAAARRRRPAGLPLGSTGYRQVLARPPLRHRAGPGVRDAAGHAARAGGPHRSSGTGRRPVAVRPARVHRPARPVLPVPRRAQRQLPRGAEGVLLADPRPAHRLLRAAEGLDRDRRRQPGGRQRPGAPDGVRAGEPHDPRAPHAVRPRLARVGAGERHPPVGAGVPHAAPGPPVERGAEGRGDVLHAARLAHAVGRAALVRRGHLRGPHRRARVRHGQREPRVDVQGVREDRAQRVRAGGRAARGHPLAGGAPGPRPAVLPGRGVPRAAGQGAAARQGARARGGQAAGAPGEGVAAGAGRAVAGDRADGDRGRRRRQPGAARVVTRDLPRLVAARA